LQSVRTVPCPRCGALSKYSEANQWRPFCSERCRMIDLGKWASDEYRLPGEKKPPDDNDSSSKPPES
jgi:hypothetical protein